MISTQFNSTNVFTVIVLFLSRTVFSISEIGVIVSFKCSVCQRNDKHISIQQYDIFILKQFMLLSALQYILLTWLLGERLFERLGWKGWHLGVNTLFQKMIVPRVKGDLLVS